MFLIKHESKEIMNIYLNNKYICSFELKERDGKFDVLLTIKHNENKTIYRLRDEYSLLSRDSFVKVARLFKLQKSSYFFDKNIVDEEVITELLNHLIYMDENISVYQLFFNIYDNLTLLNSYQLNENEIIYTSYTIEGFHNEVELNIIIHNKYIRFEKNNIISWDELWNIVEDIPFSHMDEENFNYKPFLYKIIYNFLENDKSAKLFELNDLLYELYEKNHLKYI